MQVNCTGTAVWNKRTVLVWSVTNKVTEWQHILLPLSPSAQPRQSTATVLIISLWYQFAFLKNGLHADHSERAKWICELTYITKMVTWMQWRADCRAQTKMYSILQEDTITIPSTVAFVAVSFHQHTTNTSCYASHYKSYLWTNILITKSSFLSQIIDFHLNKAFFRPFSNPQEMSRFHGVVY